MELLLNTFAAWQKSSLGKCQMSFGHASSRCCRGAIRDKGNGANIGDERAAGVRPYRRATFLRPSCMCCAPVVSGRRCPRALAAPAPSTCTFSVGAAKGSLCAYGVRVWPSMTRWKGLLGNGKAWTGRKAKRPWHKRLWETTQPTGGKKGTKRSLLVDGRGAPLSLIVAGANRHDVKLLGLTLDAIVIQRPKPTARRPQNLCVDKGYAGKPAEKQMRDRGYIPHVPVKGAPKAKRYPTRGKARRWVVERTHSWMNNFRKLRVRYEKKAANFEGLLHLAIAIICWRM